MINPKGLPRSMQYAFEMLVSAQSPSDLKPTKVQELGSLSCVGYKVPSVIDACVCIFCSDHGIAVDSVSSLACDFASQSYKQLSKGHGIPFVLGECYSINVKVFDSSFGGPTKHIAYSNAMNVREYLKCLRLGWKVGVETKCNILGVGEVGAGATSAAAALTCLILNMNPEKIVGCGSGISQSQIENKISLIRLALDRVQATDIITILCQIGGKEIVSIMGAILGASATGKIVVLDGFVTCIAALLAEIIRPGISSQFICCTRTNEPGHRLLAAHLGLKPFMHIGHTCGMGLGCFFSIQICKGAASLCFQTPDT